MGKRGPTPKGEYADKSAVLSTRISTELRAQLEKAVKRSGLTLSREVEHRLRRSFQEETRYAETFGNKRNYRLMQLVGIAMTLRDPDRRGADWLGDPELFVQVLATIHNLLWAVRPAGTEEQLTAAGWQAEMTAEEIWATIQEADETIPLKASVSQDRANKFKVDLGPLLDRVKYFHHIPEPPPEVHTSKRGKTK